MDNPTQKPNVFVLTVDSLSQSAFQPHLSKISDIVDGVSFTNAIATGCHTASAVPGLAAGIYDDKISSQGIPEEGSPAPVAEVFLESGYDTGFWTDNFLFGAEYNYDRGYVAGNLGNPSQKKQLSRAIQNSPLSPVFSTAEWVYFNILQKARSYVGEYSQFYKPAESLNNSVLQWLDDEETSSPVFCWVHYMDTHHPYEPPTSYLDLQHLHHDWTRSELGEISRAVIKSNGEGHDMSVIEDVRAAYDATCQHLAEEIQSFIAALIESGHFVPDKDIIVLTADHGEELDPDSTGVLGHVPPTFPEDVVNVPLMVAAPPWESSTVDTQVSLIDLMPTLANLAGVGIPDSVEGRPAERPSDLSRDSTVAVSRAHSDEDEPVRTYRMIRRPEWKLFSQENPKTGQVEYLLTRHNGREEIIYRTNDLTPPESKAEHKQWQKLWNLLEQMRGEPFESGIEDDESNIPREHLRDLGYLDE